MKKIIGLVLIISLALCLCVSCGSAKKAQPAAETAENVKTEAPVEQKNQQVADVDLVGKWIDWTYSNGKVENRGLWFTNSGKVYILTKEGKTYYYSNDAKDTMSYAVSGNRLTMTAENGQTVVNLVSIKDDVLSVENPSDSSENITLKKSNIIPSLKKAKAAPADVNVLGMWLKTSSKGGTFDDEGLWFADNGKIYPLVKYNGVCYYSDDPNSVMSYSVAGSLMTITFADGDTVTTNVKINNNKLTMLDLKKLKGEMTLTKFSGRVERLTTK
ncbi:MAG: hypothetical protein J5798_03970 [Spirochaetaceae bacterium]|nr:hypothetical protein [Spirochaetaceae bacterium]